MTRDEILQRYRHLRAISIGHHSGALKFLPDKRFWSMQNGSGWPLEGCWSRRARRR